MARFGKKDDIHITPDVSYIQNPDVAHEGSDVNVPAILKFVAGLVIFGIVVHVLMWAMFKFLEGRQAKLERENPPAPMALTGQQQLPPEPRLQDSQGWSVQVDASKRREFEEQGYRVDPSGRVNLELEEPQAERKILTKVWDEELQNGKVDPGTGARVSIPIAQAMQQVLSQGLPARQQQGSDEQISNGQQIPTYQSSGRMTERRRQ